MQTSGIITGYIIKWMKSCEYLRLMNLPEGYDCRRVIPENTMNFTKREVGITPLSALVNDLDPYTLYRFEFCARTLIGYGPCSNITYRTDETSEFLTNFLDRSPLEDFYINQLKPTLNFTTTRAQ